MTQDPILDGLRSAASAVERQVHARPDALREVRRRRRSRQRTRRVIAAGLAVFIVAGVGVAGLAIRSAQLADVAAAPVVDGRSVQRLAPSWKRSVDGAGLSGLTVAGDSVYLAADDGKLHALDVRSGTTRWVGLTEPGAPTTPVVADGTVLVQVAGEVYAFDVGCAQGGAECMPRWKAATGGGSEASPVVTGRTVYVVASPGGLKAFPIACEAVCTPRWTAPDPSGHGAHPPAVADGVVWDSSAHALSAYPATCGTTGGECGAIVDAVRPAGADLSSGPAVAEGVLYVGASDGTLYAVSTACAQGGACDPIWRARTGGSIVATPVVADGRVYAASSDGLVYAFAARCADGAGTCAPLWIGGTGAPIKQQPVVADGVVFVSSTDGRVYAFAEDCRSDGRQCAPLATWQVGDLPASPATWMGRAVLTVAAEGTITAWSVDGTPLAAQR